MNSKIQIVLSGETPSKKNSKNIIVNNGRRIITSSAFFKQWEKVAINELWMYKQNRDIMKFFGECRYPLIMVFEFVRKTRRRFDYINMMQGPLDIMVGLQLIPDDSADYVMPVPGGYYVDPEHPRVIINIFSKVMQSNEKRQITPPEAHEQSAE